MITTSYEPIEHDKKSKAHPPMNIIDQTMLIVLPWPIFLSFLNPEAYRRTLGRCPSKLILPEQKRSYMPICEKLFDKRMNSNRGHLIMIQQLYRSFIHLNSSKYEQ